MCPIACDDLVMNLRMVIFEQTKAKSKWHILKVKSNDFILEEHLLLSLKFYIDFVFDIFAFAADWNHL